jgi:anti-sigma-K factor RskA
MNHPRTKDREQFEEMLSAALPRAIERLLEIATTADGDTLRGEAARAIRARLPLLLAAARHAETRRGYWAREALGRNSEALLRLLGK